MKILQNLRVGTFVSHVPGTWLSTRWVWQSQRHLQTAPLPSSLALFISRTWRVPYDGFVFGSRFFFSNPWDGFGIVWPTLIRWFCVGSMLGKCTFRPMEHLVRVLDVLVWQRNKWALSCFIWHTSTHHYHCVHRIRGKRVYLHGCVKVSLNQCR